MASIAKRPDGSWRARYRDAERREHSKHFARRVDAQAWLDSVTTSVQTGSYVDPRAGRATVGALAEAWLAGKVDLAQQPRARRRLAARTCAPALGERAGLRSHPLGRAALGRGAQ